MISDYIFLVIIYTRRGIIKRPPSDKGSKNICFYWRLEFAIPDNSKKPYQKYEGSVYGYSNGAGRLFKEDSQPVSFMEWKNSYIIFSILHQICLQIKCNYLILTYCFCKVLDFIKDTGVFKIIIVIRIKIIIYLCLFSHFWLLCSTCFV